MRNKSLSAHLLDGVITLLCIALVGAAIFAVSSLRDSLDLNYDADSFYYRLSDGDFGAMVEMYYSNESMGAKADEELRQYYAIARFYEAAIWYRAYAGQPEAADYLAKMDEARGAMGELSFVAEDIRSQLKIG